MPSNKILQAFFYLLGPNYIWHFNMRYPVFDATSQRNLFFPQQTPLKDLFKTLFTAFNLHIHNSQISRSYLSDEEGLVILF